MTRAGVVLDRPARLYAYRDAVPGGGLGARLAGSAQPMAHYDERNLEDPQLGFAEVWSSPPNKRSNDDRDN